MAPARPRCLATTMAFEAGRVTRTAPHRGAEATAATPAGTGREGDTPRVREEPTEAAEEEEEEEHTEEQAGDTEEATGKWAGAAGSEAVQWSIPTSTKVCFLPKFLSSSSQFVCLFWFLSTSTVL